MWSFGCILAEMLLGHRIFDGEMFRTQWFKFVDILGWTDLTFLMDDQIGQISEEKMRYINSIERKEAKPWEEIIPNGR